MIPNTPLAGTANTDPFLTPEQYQAITRDTTSSEDAITTAIEEAADMFCYEVKRTLRYGQYVEDLYLYANGMVYPSCPPLDRTKPISSGDVIYDPSTDDLASGSIIQGDGVWVGWFTPLPFMPVWTGVIPPQTAITYWGGYQPYQVTDGSTPGMPPKLARVLARIAWYTLNPTILTGAPAGAKSVSVGGVSLSGDLSSFMLTDAQLRKDIKRYRLAAVHPWET